MLLLLTLGAISARAQDNAPLITGSVGFLYSKDAGQTFLQPVIEPVVLVPIGSNILVEGSAYLQGFVSRPAPGQPYEASFFHSLQYLQVDWIVNSHLTIVAGRFLTPFDIYNERLGPIWVHSFQDDPLIYPIGTRTSGSSNGGMIRGALISKPNWLLNYTAFFSAGTDSDTFKAGRAFGTRFGVFFPKQRFEIGTSYQRFVQDQHQDVYGAYVSWQPTRAPLDVKAEYAHSPQGEGYWVEGGYRFSDKGRFGSILKNVQPIARGQQFFRLSSGVNDSLPSVDTQRVDFGLNYYLPHAVRINAKYGRQFSSLGNSNNWGVDIIYRFLMPMPFWPKGAK